MTYREQTAGMIIIPHDGDMVSWADGKLKLPYSERKKIFTASESPWLLEPMRAMSDPAIFRVDVRGPAGSAKSLIGEIAVAFAIMESHGLFYYVWQSDDDAKDTIEDRIMPMILENEYLAARLPKNVDDIRKQKIVFPGLSFYCISAKPSKSNSKRVRTLVMEEPHMWEPGMMTAFEKRCEGAKNPKILTLSTGSIVDDESDKSFRAGSCEVWQVPCPHCGEFQTMTDNRERLVADITEETTDANGEFIWHKILPTVRYNCEHCKKDWPSDQRFRHEQSKAGKYVATNPNAAADHRSFHMEAVSVHYFPLSKILMEKLSAVAAYRMGAIVPFKKYMQLRRAMAWDEAPEVTDEQAAFDRSKGDYRKGDAWAEELCRFLTVDNQQGQASVGKHRWLVCRAWGLMETRLIWEGKVTTWEDVESKRIELQVAPNRTLVDKAFDGSDVERQCLRFGWYGLHGDPTRKESFPHRRQVLINNTPVDQITRLPFSPSNCGLTARFGNSTRQAIYFFWAQSSIKDMWHRMKNGLTDYRWTVPQDVSEEYQKQTSVEFKRRQTDRNGKQKWEWLHKSGAANHLTDCDQMNLVAALMDPQIRQILWSSKEETKEKETT